MYLFFDTETTGLDLYNDNIIGISFSIVKYEAFYVPVNSDFKEGQIRLEKFKEVLENPAIAKIGHNIKFDMMMVKRYDIDVNGTLFDTMIAHYLLQTEQNHKMDSLAKIYLNYKPIPIEELIGEKGRNQRNMKDVALDVITEYAAEDADITLQLKDKLVTELEKSNLHDLFYNIHCLDFAFADCSTNQKIIYFYHIQNWRRR